MDDTKLLIKQLYYTRPAQLKRMSIIYDKIGQIYILPVVISNSRAQCCSGVHHTFEYETKLVIVAIYSSGQLSTYLQCQVVAFLLATVEGLGGELEAQLVDGEVVLAGMVLECTSEEALREEEARYPVGLGITMLYPVLHRRGEHMPVQLWNKLQHAFCMHAMSVLAMSHIWLQELLISMGSYIMFHFK